MKKMVIGVLVFLCSLLLSSPLFFAGNEEVELSPQNPYPSENLLCKYLTFQRGDVVEFIWKVNDEVKDNKVVDKPSTIFIGEKKKNDNVKCEVNLLDPATLQRNVHIGVQSVTVGRYECNDGLDNEGDGFIDAQDQDCATRTTTSEGAAITLTPEDPYPSENLLCKFLYWEENDVLEFAWFVNDAIKQRQVIDKESSIFSKQTQRNDVVRCEVYHYDPATQRRGNTVGIEDVTVGKYVCNDGVDNDNDGLIDGQDNACTSRQWKSEFRIETEGFCENHPEQVFCLGLGLREVNDLCVRNLNNELCQQDIQFEAFDRCAGNEDTILCRGVEDVAAYCEEHRRETMCTIFLTLILQCQEQQHCHELTEKNKEFLCLLRSYSFCLSQDIPPANEPPQDQPRRQLPAGQPPALPQPPAGLPENESVLPSQFSPVCGNGICELNEHKTCPQDCVRTDKGTPGGQQSNVLLAGLIILVSGAIGAVIYFWKRKKIKRKQR
ncbi:MAG: hypothetical protein AABX37_03860 [Nanoarchaeota archaeon]